MKERKESIDARLYTTAQILLSSEILDSQHIDMQRAEAILENQVGRGHAENFFLVRNASGRILYKFNIQASRFEYIPLDSPWHTVNHPEKYIRVLSLKLPKLNDRSLQVGIIVNKQLVIPQFFSRVTWLTVVFINGIGLLIAWLLANFLTRPIRHLSGVLNKKAQIDKGTFSIENISVDEFRPKQNSHDEFDVLIISINELINRVNHGLHISRLWTYQMSHEIKTPLSIMSSIINQNSSSLKETVTDSLRTQIFKISETINAFLSWAEAQNIRPQLSHFIRISRLITDVVDKLKIKITVPLKISVVDDFIVGINYNQMEQLLTNLLVNAYNHGDQQHPIEITCQNDCLVIANHGSPFPPQIIEKLGTPFNKGDSQQEGPFSGTGLGLAYVHTICQMNNYPLHIGHDSGITIVKIDLSTSVKEAQKSQAQS
jgi:signal transduction histidine kinase